jgi:hypothetical protein
MTDITPPRSASTRRLAAARQRRQQIDHLDAGLEQFALRVLIGQSRRRPMDRPARHFRPEFRTLVARLPHDIDQPSQHRIADRNANR